MPESKVCGVQHPLVEGLACALYDAPNATTQDVYDMVNGEVLFREDGSPVVKERGKPVHVHKGLAGDGSTHRWEDTPEN